MKPAPTKNNTAKLSTNQRIASWHEIKQNEREKALEVAEKSKDLPHLKNKPIVYDLKL